MNNLFDDVGADIAKQLMHIRVQLSKDQVIEKDIRPDVTIDYDMLEEQLQQTPATFAFWSMLLAESKKQVAIFERAIQRRKGEVTKMLLDEAKNDGTKLRGSDVKDLIEADDDLNSLNAQLILANRTQSKLFAVVEAMRMKSEHLRSLAGFKRQELRDADNNIT